MWKHPAQDDETSHSECVELAHGAGHGEAYEQAEDGGARDLEGVGRCDGERLGLLRPGGRDLGRVEVGAKHRGPTPEKWHGVDVSRHIKKRYSSTQT